MSRERFTNKKREQEIRGIFPFLRHDEEKIYLRLAELEDKIESGELHDGFKIGDEVWGIAFNTTKPMVHGKIIQMYLNEKCGRVFIQDVDDKEFYTLCGYHYQIDVSLNAVYRTKKEAEDALRKMKDNNGI